MKRKLLFSAICLLTMMPALAQYPQGSLAVLRIGQSSSPLSDYGNRMYIDIYNGSFLYQSVPLPNFQSGQNNPVYAPSYLPEFGYLSRSGNGQYLSFAAFGSQYTSKALENTTGSEVKRVIGTLAADGKVNTSIALSDYAAPGWPYCAYTSDGSQYWIGGGASGLRYVTSGSTSTLISGDWSGVTYIGAYDNQLYVNNTYQQLGTVGTGLPVVSGQSITTLAGPATFGKGNFLFLDEDVSVSGVDVLYVCNVSGVQKYSKVNSSWVSNGQITATNAFALTGVYNSGFGSSTALYYTTDNGKYIYTYSETGGYNTPLQGSGPTLFLTAATNTFFRGLAMSPQCAQASAPSSVSSSLVFSGVTTSSLSLNWSSGNGLARIVVARESSTSAIAPTNGKKYNASVDYSNPAASNGTTGTGNIVVYSDTGKSVNVTGLSSAKEYAFDIYEYNGMLSCINYGTTATGLQSTAMPTSISGSTSEIQFKAYPNPASDEIQIESKIETESEILNAYGEKIETWLLQPGKNTRSLIGLSPGIYYLRIKKTNHIERIVIMND
jgi:hypothetical protein